MRVRNIGVDVEGFDYPLAHESAFHEGQEARLTVSSPDDEARQRHSLQEVRMSMLQSRKSGASCHCCNESLVPVGTARAREAREWQQDYHRGEVDSGKGPWLTDDVHSLTEPGGLCTDWPGSNSGDGAWDYDQEHMPFWWYQAIIPAEHRLPQAA